VDTTDNVKDTSYEELQLVFHKCPKYNRKFCLEISVPKKARKAFSIRQFGMNVHKKLAMIMEVE
jgi:hypothetical protein